MTASQTQEIEIDLGPFDENHPYISRKFFEDIREYVGTDAQNSAWRMELARYDTERLTFAFSIICDAHIRAFNAILYDENLNNNMFNLTNVAGDILRTRVAEDTFTQIVNRIYYPEDYYDEYPEDEGMEIV